MTVRPSALGLLACAAALSGIAHSQARPADIVYACDQSGSMELKNIWISPDGRDTAYLSSTAGCTGYTANDLNGFGSVTVLSETGTRQVSRINPAKPPMGCGEFSGDPFGQRAVVMRAAIDFQALRAPGSRAGYLGFGSGLSGATAPRALNSAADVEAVKANIKVLNNGNTNYHIALDQAKQWLADPNLSPNPAKAVVFLSDGRPNTPDTASYLEVLSPAYAGAPGIMPPIYGIFIGYPLPDTARLHELSRVTAGRFFLVPPTRPDSLAAVMERILDLILNPDPTTVAKPGRAPGIPSSSPAFRDLLGRFRTAGSKSLRQETRR